MFYHSKIKEALARKGGDVEVAFTRKAGDGTILAHNYLRKGYSRIVAVSGDGTINKVANGFFEVKEQEDGNRIFKPINSNAIITVFPCGTRNVLVKSLGLPSELTECFKNHKVCKCIIHLIYWSKNSNFYCMICMNLRTVIITVLQEI